MHTPNQATGTSRGHSQDNTQHKQRHLSNRPPETHNQALLPYQSASTRLIGPTPIRAAVHFTTAPAADRDTAQMFREPCSAALVAPAYEIVLANTAIVVGDCAAHTVNGFRGRLAATNPDVHRNWLTHINLQKEPPRSICAESHAVVFVGQRPKPLHSVGGHKCYNTPAAVNSALQASQDG